MYQIHVHSDDSPAPAGIVEEMFRLRYRLFVEKFKWNVSHRDGMEIDEFDELPQCTHFIVSDKNGIAGSTRLLPSTGPYLVEKFFPQAIDGALPKEDSYWEVSRATVELAGWKGREFARTVDVQRELFGAMYEWCLARHVPYLFGVADVRFRAVTQAFSLPREPMGPIIKLSDCEIYAGLIFVSQEGLQGIRASARQPVAAE
jgi:N-acyl-L-homoserine lactone synthetase